MSYETIILGKKDGIARITMNIPEKLNPLDLVMREELKESFRDIAADKAVRVVVMTGAGKAFCAGGDITTMAGIRATAGRDRLKNVQELVRLMTSLEKPIIAAVNGFATGAGMHIALACDIIIASEKAKFRESFILIGLIPDMGGFYLLPGRVGLARAKELMMTGRLFDAKEAESMGIINKVVPPEDLEGEVMDLAQTLARGPARAYAMIKSALNRWPMSLQSCLELEANMQAIALSSADFDEGRRSFLEKRQPQFMGE
ncbi:MAG: enoyl-CoA hydratase [Deltaproteobacteria bacterium]|nr:enoyl-CoA hydratase [Deltaproteobacteria bacterium]